MSLVWAGFVSFVASAISAPLVYKLLLQLKSRQTVSQHLPEHAKKQGTPTMGGIIILIGLLAGAVATWQREMLAPMILVLGYAAIGLVDDFVIPRMDSTKRGLGWMQKLVLQVAFAGLACWVGDMFDMWQIALAIFCILFFSNAYNFADGLDTLAGGLGLIWCFGLFFLATIGLGAESELKLLLALGIGFIPFLLLNAPPAKVFMGDVGALPIGALMGWLFFRVFSGLADPSQSVLSPTMVIVMCAAFSLVFVLELVPVPLQIASVKILKRRMFNFKTPIHHGMQDAGWSEGRIVMFFHLVQIVLILGALGFAFSGIGGVL